MWELVLSVGLKLIGWLFSDGESKDKIRKRFYEFIAEHAGDSAIPVKKRQEYLDLKKKLNETPDNKGESQPPNPSGG